jgi:RNA polymerase sigma-70 factor (ECF subfamily)
METDRTTDKELLERIQDKDSEAFAVFYRRHYVFIARRIKSLMADEDMANDFIQEFWIRLWEKPTMLKTNDEGYVFNFLYSFLYTFVLLIHRLYNKHASQLVSLEDLNMLPEDQQYTHVLEDVEANELIGFIDSIVDGLPEPQHSIYELYQQNHSLADIAKNVLLSEGSVRNYLTKTFKIMRDGIGKQYNKQVPAV